MQGLTKKNCCYCMLPDVPTTNAPFWPFPRRLLTTFGWTYRNPHLPRYIYLPTLAIPLLSHIAILTPAGVCAELVKSIQSDLLQLVHSIESSDWRYREPSAFRPPSSSGKAVGNELRFFSSSALEAVPGWPMGAGQDERWGLAMRAERCREGTEAVLAQAKETLASLMGTAPAPAAAAPAAG